MNTKRIALITGANKGIGFETARQLGRQQVTILLGSRDPATGEAAAARLRGEGLDVRALPLDVTDIDSIRHAVDKVAQEFGRLDILINNAGVMVDDQAKKVSEQSLDTWRTTFDTNVFGLIATTQSFLPLLRKSGAGRIVNLSSILGSNTLHRPYGSA
jgi:NAD(P)-dependent dehydrogenase (short-subunit alcohol dehydrogenase family)